MANLQALLATAVATCAVLMPASAAAQAKDDCSITYGADESMTALIAKEKFSDSYFEELCPWLAANGLELSISNDSGVLAERAFAWVSVRVMRTASKVTSGRASQSTVVRETATSDEAYDAMREALDSALTGLTNDRANHLRELVESERAVGRGQ